SIREYLETGLQTCAPPICHLTTGAPSVCGLARTPSHPPNRRSIQQASKARIIKRRMTAIVGIAPALVNRLIALWRYIPHSPLSPCINYNLIYSGPMNDATLPDPLRPSANATEPPAPAAVAPAPVRRYRARLFQLYVLLATIAFSGLAFFAHAVNYFPLDLQITLAIQSIHNGFFDVLMRYLTILGFAPQATLLSALTVLFLFTSGLKWEALAAGLSVTGASALGQLAKLVV